MNRIPPSERISKEIQDLINGEKATDGSLLSAIMRKGAEKLIQEALESELTGSLGRARYVRQPGNDDHTEDSHIYRNGYKYRALRTAEGKLQIAVPQVRNTKEPYQSKLWQFLRGNSDMLDMLVTEMYARGLSTRDIEDAFTDPEGNKLLSKSQVSRITEHLHDEYKAFAKRSLDEFDVIYLFLDAVYEPLRKYDAQTREAILCCWGILSNGQRVLLHLDLAKVESYNTWKDFLLNMVRRGLRSPLTVTSDGNGGCIRAIDEVWSNAIRIRCWVHKMQNVLDKVPDQAHGDVKAFLESIRDAPDYATGQQLANAFHERFDNEYGRAVASLEDDLDASLAHLQLPPIHRKAVRTTNLIERCFVEERRRTKVIPRFMDEDSGLKLIYATLWRVSQRWCNVRFTELEKKQIDTVRKRREVAEKEATVSDHTHRELTA